MFVGHFDFVHWFECTEEPQTRKTRAKTTATRKVIHLFKFITSNTLLLDFTVEQFKENKRQLMNLTWIMRPITMTMATQDTISAWFWMTNSWLSMGKFLLAAAFLPFNGAIFKGLVEAWSPDGTRQHKIWMKKYASVAANDEQRKIIHVLYKTFEWTTLKIGKCLVVSIVVVGTWNWVCGSWVGRSQVADVSIYTCRRVFTFSVLITVHCDKTW